MPFTQNTTPTIGKQPTNGKATIVNSDGQNWKALYIAGPNGSRTASIVGVSSDTVSRDVQIAIIIGGTVTGNSGSSGGTVSGGNIQLIGCISIVANGGFSSGTAGTNVLNASQIVGLPVDSDGNYFLNLLAGDVLAVSAVTTVTSTKTIYITTLDVTDF